MGFIMVQSPKPFVHSETGAKKMPRMSKGAHQRGDEDPVGPRRAAGKDASGAESRWIALMSLK
jgi:hypothetical protein